MKKKNPYKLLLDTMGGLKICMVLSIACAVCSAYYYVLAYTYVYEVAREVLSVGKNFAAIQLEFLKDCGWNTLMCIGMGYGMYGLALLFSHITAFNTAARLKVKLVRHIGCLPLGYHDTHSGGAIRKILEKNTEMSETLIAHQIPNTAQAVTLPVILCIFMFRYSVWMAVACIIPVIIGFVLLMVIMMGGGADFVSNYQKAAANISNAAVEYVRGISVVKTFGQSADSFQRYKKAVEDFRDYMLKFALSMQKGDSAYNTAINSIFFTVVLGAILQYNRTGDSNVIANFIFFAAMLPMARSALKKIMSNSSESIIVKEALGVMEGMLSEKTMEYTGNEVPQGADVRLEHVSFRYAQDLPLALSDVNLEIPAGSITALVGSSGGGKSTIGSLIARFWDVTEGSIQIGGVDVRNISHETLNRMVSVVFQESTMLKTTIRENVALYRPDASEEEVREALEAAQCMDIIEKLPQGMETIYGAQGTYLSGGEMQRLAIARAILKDAPIVVLDEATAFADSENEYLIRQALKKLLAGKTVIMIAHRISTVEDADQICVIGDGRIVERGTHASLMAEDGAYKHLVEEFHQVIEWKISREVQA